LELQPKDSNKTKATNFFMSATPCRLRHVSSSYRGAVAAGSSIAPIASFCRAGVHDTVCTRAGGRRRSPPLANRVVPAQQVSSPRLALSSRVPRDAQVKTATPTVDTTHSRPRSC